MMAIQQPDRKWVNKCGSTCQAAKRTLASSKCNKKKSFANAENLFPDNVFPVLPPADKKGKINFNAKTSFGDCSKCPGWKHPVTGKTNPLSPGGGSIYKPVEINPGKGTGANDNFYLEMRADVERKCGCAMCPPGTEFKDFRRNRWDLQVGANSCGTKSQRLYPRCKPWKGKSVRSYCWGQKCRYPKKRGGHFTNPEQHADQYTNESCCAAAPGSSYMLLFYKFTTSSKDTYSCHTAPKTETKPHARGREYRVWNRMNVVDAGCGWAQDGRRKAGACDGVQFSPVSLDQLPRTTGDFGKCASPGGTALGEMAATKRGFAYQKNVWATFKTNPIATPLFYIKCRVWKHIYCFTFNVPVTKWNKTGKARKCITQKALGFDSAMQSRGGSRARTARSIVVGLPAIETNNDYIWLKLMHLEVGICHGAALGA